MSIFESIDPVVTPSTVSKYRYPLILKAKGKYCWGQNGTKYLDFTGANQTVILGYKKIKCSLPPNFPGEGPLESRAKAILHYLTNRSHFRFFKNGSDAVSCAIRLARYVTGEKQVTFLGYGGANIEYAYTVNQNGIPINQRTKQRQPLDAIKRARILVYESRYQGIASRIPAEIKICDHLKSGMMGFKEDTADIDLYGKSIANGYPLSVITGKPCFMKDLNKIFYSTTFGSENTGLAAFLYTAKHFDFNKYRKLLDSAKIILPRWESIEEEDYAWFFKNKILFNGYWQIMTCHKLSDIERLSKVIKRLKEIKEAT